MNSESKSWTATQLWQLIQDRTQEADPARQLLNNVMPEIEKVLSKGGTSPVDFTLHDEEHAFRVAERMVELLPDDVAPKLTPFEVALLLLSAYLHDIGMTPTRDVVKAHHQYILTKADGLLPETDAKNLQHWLDEAHGGLELPVSEGITTVAGLEKAEELLAYYCRYRHNDWSEAWIREHLSDAKPSLYPAWSDDLVNLCRSHHEGLEALRHDRFHARHRGSPPQVVNLRYLAALLRVADVMEFDPERTPDVIVAHRVIAPKSRIFWHKDRFSFLIGRSTREFRLDATTPDAKTHRAVLETVQQVDQELLTCNALETSGAFMLGSFKDDRCHWPWPARVNATVTAQEGSFVYIDGAFRPEPQHILKLLGGVELYKDPMVAVRELLQNALDAVKEQIARERLRLDNPGDPAWEQKLGGQHSVTLSLVEESDGFWLVCEDDGVGMTRAIIERHLLVSGASPLPEVHQLEREANTHGFSTERSAQFGIGVLSYFMIADRMVITTRRSELAGRDPHGTGWRFETEGLAGFGQLTPFARPNRGTEVRLKIRSEAVAKVQADLIKYVQDSVAYAPCRLEVVSCGLPAHVSMGPGWCRTIDALTSTLLAHIREQRYHRTLHADGLAPLSEVRRQKEQASRWEEVRHKARERLRWRDPLYGHLKAGLGRFRLHFPYFELDGGRCLAFFDIKGDRGRFIRPSEGTWGAVHGACPGGTIFHSWRGFRARGTPPEASSRRLWRHLPNMPVLMEIDWHHGASVGVDRLSVTVSNDGYRCFNRLLDRAVAEIHDAVEASYTSKYFLISRDIISRYVPAPKNHLRGQAPFYHAEADIGQDDFVWQQPSFPAVRADRRAGRKPLPQLMWKSQPLCQLMSIYLVPPDQRIWFLKNFAPDKIVSYSQATILEMYPLWEYNPAESGRDPDRVARCASFPPEWSDVAAFDMDAGEYWNRDHPLVRLIRQQDVAWLGARCPGGDPRPVARELLQHRGRMAAWLLNNAFREQDYWDGVRDNLPDLWVKLSDEVSDVAGLPLRAGTSISTITIERAGRRSEFGALPRPRGGEWTVYDAPPPEDEAKPEQ